MEISTNQTNFGQQQIFQQIGQQQNPNHGNLYNEKHFNNNSNNNNSSNNNNNITNKVSTSSQVSFISSISSHFDGGIFFFVLFYLLLPEVRILITDNHIHSKYLLNLGLPTGK
jgi:predicted PurR-regulated permease PerM